MNTINKIRNKIERIRIILLFFPYLTVTFKDFNQHSKFNLILFYLIPIILLFIDIIIEKSRTKNRLFIPIIIFVLYSELTFSTFLIEKNIYTYICLLLIYIMIFSFKIIPDIIINIFLLNLGISISLTYNPRKYSIQPYNKFTLSKNNKIQPPVLIIILDEYAAPSEIRAKNQLTPFLKYFNFKILDPLYSKEIYTINSIASLLNYDISSNTTFINNLQEIDRFELITNSQFEKDLTQLGVKIEMKNYYRNDNLKNPTPNYFMCPRNFFELISYKSIVPRIERKLLGESSFEIYNKILFKDLDSKINSNNFNNNYLYIYHFCMPHPPFKYLNEYQGINDYKSYYEFVNNKFITILSEILKNNKNNNIKIVLMGDHGKRNHFGLNSQKTFAALFNFKQSSFSKIISVQDICSAIIYEYNNDSINSY